MRRNRLLPGRALTLLPVGWGSQDRASKCSVAEVTWTVLAGTANVCLMAEITGNRMRKSSWLRSLRYLVPSGTGSWCCHGTVHGAILL